VDGTETGWGRPAESAPRWRTLLDRALHGGRTDEHQVLDDRPGAGGGRSGGRFGRSGSPPAQPGPPAGSGYVPYPRDGAEHSGESRWAALENGYRHDPFFGPAPGHRTDPGYRPDPGHHTDPGYRPSPGHPADGGRPGESRYAALAGGWQPPAPPPAGSGGPPLPRRSPSAVPGLPPQGPAEHVPGPRSGPEERLGRPIPAPRAAQAPPAAPVEPAFRPAPAPPTLGAAPVEAPGRPPRYTPPEAGYAAVPGRAAADPGHRTGRSGWLRRQTDPEVERAISVLRRDLGSPRVLAFANPKGGVHKTTATVLAAATVGSVRGRGVLAWDDNELRGTLGLRAGSARHARTIRHLVADLLEIEALPGTQLTARLDDYLRHASDGSYDVLAGEESPRFAQRLDQHTVRRVLDLLRRTHDVICVDTGNNVESANWQTVLRAADQLVVTTVPREDAAFTADWMLDLLHDTGMGELAENAVTLLSCPTPGQSPLLDDLKRHFASRTRAVAVVPYDPALETGSSIEYAQVQPETRDAWLRAASMMLEPFAR